jgi:nicotinamidase-related amidase
MDRDDAGNAEIEIVDELSDMVSGAAAVLDKPTYSLFNDEGAELFSRHGWKHIVVVGLDTDSCVLKTAVDAFELGLVHGWFRTWSAVKRAKWRTRLGF